MSYQKRFEEILAKQETPDWAEIKAKGTPAEYINRRDSKVIFGYNYNGHFYFKNGDSVGSMLGSARVMESTLNESRPVRLIDLITSIGKAEFVEDIVSVKSTMSGIVALVRTKDGNAYEINIKPAEYSDNFPELTDKDK